MPNCWRMPGTAIGHRLRSVAGFERLQLVADHLLDRLPFRRAAAWRRPDGGAASGGAARRRQTAMAAESLHAGPPAAYGTCGIARHAHFAPVHRQRVEEQQAAGERFAGARDELQRFGGLRRADDAGQRREDAHRRAARLLDLLALAEEAVVARAIARRAYRIRRSGRRSGWPRRRRAACARARTRD